MKVSKEVEKIITGKETPEMVEKIDQIYCLYKKIKRLNNTEKEKAQALVKEVLEYYFKDKFSQSYSIPIEFIESSLGKILFGLKFGVPEPAYTTAEITIIMGRTRALISYDAKNGVVQNAGKGRNIIIYENELIRYMRSKGFMNEEIRERIEKFKELKDEGYSLNEIQEIMGKTY